MISNVMVARPRMAFPAERLGEREDGWDAHSRRLAAALVARFNSPFYKPPILPPVAARLLELSMDDDPDFDLVMDLLQNDTMLTGRILRLCQSPLYRPIEPIRTLREAVTRLGVNRVRDFVMSEALHMRVFKASPFRPIMERLRRHSLAVAQISESIARVTGAHPEEAFLCGLLHDIGIAGCVIAASEDRRMSAWMSPAVAMPVINELHADAGAIIASLWKLPEHVRDVITHHHKGDPRSPRFSMTAVVCVADSFANELGAGMHSEADPHTDYLYDESDADVLTEAKFFLGLRPNQMHELRADATDIIDSLASLG